VPTNSQAENHGASKNEGESGIIYIADNAYHDFKRLVDFCKEVEIHNLLESTALRSTGCTVFIESRRFQRFQIFGSKKFRFIVQPGSFFGSRWTSFSTAL
jgi:hypothetical protein